jgi:Na+-transporting methylmalonyl-CoA/oxaloacetate decarboxylase beta subunit
MSKPFLAKHINKLIASGLLVMVCLSVLLIYVCIDAKTTEKRLLQQQFNLSLVNLSQNIDARISSMKLIAKTLANDKHIHGYVYHWQGF